MRRKAQWVEILPGLISLEQVQRVRDLRAREYGKRNLRIVFRRERWVLEARVKQPQKG